ncbi:phosphoglycolate phosphatase [Marinomonas communis]|jgi:phosphoglycolate phosphatase|uniref:Phosphoglycolate phosphatase n=1 Tax=Marinomonas communis TaxID=28254 RepID=A0A4R6XAK7_9GAMM|nr:phosphoglycolate phosphatase [Marinomonas communis]MCC4273225.1 phosphoglycolate phosphatase [Marinomonas communis]MEC8080081.1 phosphoglycolate phosphatase [Pseudomonadota bacterium]MEC8483178.1 phosphoglycolate phosphatase [Pseudomonadota bacterium]TDR12558.1 phosphoglycolate phosphatase [Marinomonas communis]
MKTPKHLKRLFEGWPELVCFDLDGTLVDSVPDIAAAMDKSLVAMGASPAGEERVRGWVGYGSAKLVQQAMEWANLPAERIEEGYKLFLKEYFDNLAGSSTLYANVESILKAFKYQKVPVALITNKPSLFIKPLLDHFGISTYFSWMLGGDSLAEKKPSPLPLLHCMEDIEAAPEKCLMVGDSLADYRAAKAAGFKCALVTYGYNHGVDLKELEADVLIDDLAELLM